MEKVKINNEDFNLMLKEYSNLIQQLNDSQKNDLNIFIKSL